MLLFGCESGEILQEEPVAAETPAPVEEKLIPDNFEKTQVIRVIDGDTIIVSGDRRIRLIGIDTPETVHPEKEAEPYGEESSAFAKKILEGKTVYLEKDQSDRDQFDRLLRYVYLEDGTFFNLIMVERGYAQTMRTEPNIKHADLLQQAQLIAKQERKGLWGLEETREAIKTVYEDDQGRGLIKGNTNSMIYHLPDGQFYDSVQNPEWFSTEKEAIKAGFRSSAR